jgi:PKD repeat protein
MIVVGVLGVLPFEANPLFSPIDAGISIDHVDSEVKPGEQVDYRLYLTSSVNDITWDYEVRIDGSDGEIVKQGSFTGYKKDITDRFSAPSELGTHTLWIKVTSPERAEFDTDSESFKVVEEQTGDPPTASFTYSPENPSDGTLVTYDASNSKNADEYIWEFDGGVITEGRVITAYASAPETTVSLTVKNPNGSDMETKTIIVDPEESDLVADFTIEPNPATAGEEVTLDASPSEGDIETYEWEIDDEIVGTGKTMTVSYNESLSDKRIRLYVYGSDGGRDTRSDTLEITINDPLARINVEPGENVAVGQTVTFSGTGSKAVRPQLDSYIQSYRWTIGLNKSDPRTVMGKEVEHVFDEVGVYQVELMVQTNLGKTHSETVTIDVSAKPKHLIPLWLSLSLIIGGVAIEAGVFASERWSN